jgi:hypothetical protein
MQVVLAFKLDLGKRHVARTVMFQGIYFVRPSAGSQRKWMQQANANGCGNMRCVGPITIDARPRIGARENTH